MQSIDDSKPTKSAVHGTQVDPGGKELARAKSARPIPDELTISIEQSEEDSEARAEIGVVREDTNRLRAQLLQMEATARGQNRRQMSTYGSSGDLAQSLAKSLTHVGNQTLKRNELLRRHRTCLGALRASFRIIDDSHRALEHPAESPIAQRQRDKPQ